MMRYYDTVETPKTQKIFLEDGENRIPETDDRVKIWFTENPDPSAYSRDFDNDGLPILKPIIIMVDPVDELYKTYLQKTTEPVTVNGVIFKGGKSSSQSIEGAVTLAIRRGETVTNIVDVSGHEHEYTFEETLDIAAEIAFVWREAYLEYNRLVTALEE